MTNIIRYICPDCGQISTEEQMKSEPANKSIHGHLWVTCPKCQGCSFDENWVESEL